MYKVKLFTATSQEELEKSINAFLSSIDNFFDIKYEIAGGYCHNAMIIYTEVDKISVSRFGKILSAKIALENERSYHQYLRHMKQETDEEYFNWLAGAAKAAYEQGIITPDDYRKYTEEWQKDQQE